MLVVVSFIIGFISDFLWSRSIHAVRDNQPFWAANFSTLLYLCGILSTELVVDRQFIAILGFVVGGYIGTYFGVKNRKNDVPSHPGDPSSLIKIVGSEDV